MRFTSLSAFALLGRAWSRSDSGSFVQIHEHGRAVVRHETKPSDVAALFALYIANGNQSTLEGWGTSSDPCVGPPPPGQANAQGFGPWKGVACVPCSDDERYWCVSQIWQHQKNLNGTIPETFRGLSELRWLFLSGNNLTGPFPQNNWFTFPRLRILDISYNNINGTLPLDRLSSIPNLRSIYANDNHFDDVCYQGGGFPLLRELVFMYNRNMTGSFPHGIASIPNLQVLEIHDTGLTGSLPDGPWPRIENMIITGTGGLCGPLPSACQRPGMFCDVVDNFADCPGELIFGAPLASFHNATIYVYQQAMLQLGFKVKVISNYIHPVLFAMFTGFGGTDSSAGCKEVGCADKCNESGLGSESPCIDFVVDSNIPVNHAIWLEPYQAMYDVMGTAFETQYITLFAPDYANTGGLTVTEAAEDPDFDKDIIGFKGGPADNCGTLYCPKCATGDFELFHLPPLAPNNFTYKSYACPDFAGEVQKRLDAKKKFMIFTWTPQVWPAAFPILPVDLQNYTNKIKPNEGKAQIRNSARWKFSDKAFAVLGAIYIGTRGVQEMDAWSHGYRLDGEGPLCDYYTFDSACSLEAVQRWIKRNQDHVNKYGTVTQGIWKTFFW